MVAMLLPLLVLAIAVDFRTRAAHDHNMAYLRRGAPGFLQLHWEAPAAANLEVGTESGKANVVSNFEVVSTWGSGDDLAASVPPTSPATDFYLRATGGNLQLARAVVEPTSLPHLRAYLDGELAKQLGDQGQVNLRPNEERRLSLAYDCHSPGEASLTLTLDFEGLSSVQIPIKKTCGGEQNTALTVTVGSARDGEQVAVMGAVKWDELKVVGVRPAATTFSVYVDPLSEKGEQVISTPTVAGIGACAARMAPDTSAKFGSGKMSLAAGAAVDVGVDYRCFRHGKCIVTTEVPFFPDMAPYRPLRWSWTKLCGGDALGIDVEIPEAGARRLLASDGAANTSDTQWIAEPEMDKHTVRLVNDQKRSLESQVKLRSLTVRCLDSARCTARLSDSIPQFLSAASPLDLHVEYDCHSSGSSIVQLVLATEGHDNVVTTWAKDCKAFADSFLGVILIMVCTGTCFACACVGFMRLFFEGGGGTREKPLLEGEFIEDEHLTTEEVAALDHYEEFYGLQKGAASIEQVKDSVLGISGWATKGPVEASDAPPLPPPPSA